MSNSMATEISKFVPVLELYMFAPVPELCMFAQVSHSIRDNFHQMNSDMREQKLKELCMSVGAEFEVVYRLVVELFVEVYKEQQ